jgi:glycosyltransferase involved in cell wall biosynthesis
MRRSLLRIILCHNYFRERGGEDQVFEDELELLTSHGHEVTTFIKHNDDLEGAAQTLKVALTTPWNRSAAHELADLVREADAEVVHFHNWLPQISPAAFYGARKAGAAVVLTLHNYRWICPKGILFRDGNICEDCVGKTWPLPAVRHGCYHESRAGSAAVATTLGLHNLMNTTDRAVDAYIALGEFARNKLTAAALPSDRVHLKPNFLTSDPGQGSGEGGFAMYLGRLSPEKKIDTLLEAWGRLGGTVPLKIFGGGPLADLVEDAAAKDPSIEYMGFVPNEEVIRQLGEARALVFTSGTYEGLPKTIVESYAKGTPVIAFKFGSMEDLVEDGQTGWHVKPGDTSDLARVVDEVFSMPGNLESMRGSIRQRYLDSYTPDANHARLIEIYERAVAHRADVGG